MGWLEDHHQEMDKAERRADSFFAWAKRGLGVGFGLALGLPGGFGALLIVHDFLVQLW